MKLSTYDYEREGEKARAWDDYRREIGDVIYSAARKGKDFPNPNNEEAFVLWHLSEDAYSLEYNPARICDFVHKLEFHREMPAINEVMERLTILLDQHFNVSMTFWNGPILPHETARSYKVPR
jgi:hypothetical protein